MIKSVKKPATIAGTSTNQWMSTDSGKRDRKRDNRGNINNPTKNPIAAPNKV
jgi:hypothetical protein